MAKQLIDYINEALKRKKERTMYDIVGVKNKWVALDKNMTDELSKEIYVLVDFSYSYIGGHSKIKSFLDVANEMDSVMAVDWDEDPNMDVVIFGKKSKYGIKLTGVATDGKKYSKELLTKKQTEMLGSKGYYAEVSGAAFGLLAKQGLKPIEDEKTVRNLLKKDIEWHGLKPENSDGRPDKYGFSGWYTRKIGGEPHTKILFGKI